MIRLLTPTPAVAAALLFTLAAVPAGAQECAPGSLTLVESGTQPLPPTFGIDGLSTGPGGSLVLWSAEGELLRIHRPGSLVRRRLPDSIRPAGVVVTADGYRLLDRATGRESLVSPDSGGPVVALGRIPLTSDQLLDHAIWHSGAWVVGVRDGATRRFIVVRVMDEGVQTLFVSTAGDGPRTIPRFHLGADGTGILLTRLTAPFEIIRLTNAGADTLRVPFGSGGLPVLAPDSIDNWRALPAVAIDCGVLLTLSDLTNDRRLLLRYDRAGALQHVTELRAPFGLMTRLPGEERLLAARRVGGLELVWYDWRWVRETPGSH